MICWYVAYTLRLRAPVLFTAPGTDPNAVRSLPFIPGSAMRGAAARVLGDPGSDAARLDRFRRLVLDGSVRFLNAYPRAGQHRALPMPLSMRVDRSEPIDPTAPLQALDLAAFPGNAGDGEWPHASLAPVPEPFVTVGAQRLRIAPARSSKVHHQRDRARGRAWTDPETEEAHGSVFAFEYLEEAQEFDGFAQVLADTESECDKLAAGIQAVLNSPVVLGRSRRGGYGGAADIEWRTVSDREVKGPDVITSDLAPETEFRLLLTSPYVGRDPETGQLDPARLSDEIVELLDRRVEVLRRRWSFELVGGFNRKWRLEVPQALACAGGSVLVLRSTDSIPLAALLEIEHRGLGERRVDGFGRFVFLEAPLATQVLRTPTAIEATRPPGEPPPLVRFAQERMIKNAVERAIRQEAARLARRARYVPTAALLGRLRNAMRAPPAAALVTLREWLDGRLRAPAMDQIDRCRIDGKRLSQWLQIISNEGEAELAALLRFDTLAQRFHIDSEGTARAHLASDMVTIRAQMIEATLAALARARRQERTT